MSVPATIESISRKVADLRRALELVVGTIPLVDVHWPSTTGRPSGGGCGE